MSGVTLQSAKHHAAPPVYPCLPKKPVGIIRVGKLNRAPNTANARLVCTSFVDKPCACEWGYKLECQTPHCTSCASLLSEEAIWNTYGSVNSTVCQTPQMHLLCALYWWESHPESVRVRLLNRFSNSALDTLCTPCLAKKPFGVRTSRETQQCAKHGKCTSGAPFLNGGAM